MRQPVLMAADWNVGFQPALLRFTSSLWSGSLIGFQPIPVLNLRAEPTEPGAVPIPPNPLSRTKGGAEIA